jgi:hypothetical protein
LDTNDDLSWIARGARRGARIQSLWSGYGELFRVHLSDARTVVVKHVKPPRAAASDVGHARKCRSYEVEARWYASYASRCDDTCRVPSLVASAARAGEQLFALEDLDAAGFPDRRRSVSDEDLDACLAWLASFHARFLGVAPEGLWETGTYWHLATRKGELAVIDDDELREAAPVLDEKLQNARFKTLVHGDAKLANFCFGRAVAAVDFQYVGGGCGMKDVAYLVCGHHEDEAREARHVDRYFTHLRRCLPDSDDLEREWRALYPIACADFYRFLAGWSPHHFRSDGYAKRRTREILRAL